METFVSKTKSNIDELMKTNISNEEKIKMFDTIIDEIQKSKKYLDGTWTYCEECKDWYLSKSYSVEHSEETTTIVTYNDPINSGGNEYARGIAKITYSVCPKSHKKVISKEENLL